MSKGEYIDFDEPSKLYISENVGRFRAIKRHRKSHFHADELFEVEINKETLLETETDMQTNTSKFYERFKGKLPRKSAEATGQAMDPKETE